MSQVSVQHIGYTPMSQYLCSTFVTHQELPRQHHVCVCSPELPRCLHVKLAADVAADAAGRLLNTDCACCQLCFISDAPGDA